VFGGNPSNVLFTNGAARRPDIIDDARRRRAITPRAIVTTRVRARRGCVQFYAKFLLGGD
jgi:hypothetical protein